MDINIDFISDIHVEHHLHHRKVDVITYFNSLLPDSKQSDILIIAGDIANTNKQGLEFLFAAKRHYREVLFCLGNHEFYIPKGIETSEYRTLKFIEGAQELGCKWLGGDVYNVSGVRIGGTHAWYDGSYARVHYNMLPKQIYNLFKKTMNDYLLIVGMDVFKSGVIEEQKRKLEKIKDKVDVMVTHVPPITTLPMLPENHKNPVTGFFSFDGEYLFHKNIRLWIFGHTHFKYCFRRVNKNPADLWCIANPIGYPTENNNTKIQTFIIEV